MKRLIAILILALPMAANAGLVEIQVDLETTCRPVPFYCEFGFFLPTVSTTDDYATWSVQFADDQQLQLGPLVDGYVEAVNLQATAGTDDGSILGGPVSAGLRFLDADGNYLPFDIYSNNVWHNLGDCSGFSDSCYLNGFNPAESALTVELSEVVFSGFELTIIYGENIFEEVAWSTGVSSLQIFGQPYNGVSVPEPGTFALFGIGLAGLGFARLRRKA